MWVKCNILPKEAKQKKAGLCVSEYSSNAPYIWVLMDDGGGGNNVTYLSSLPISVRMYFLLNKDALGNACHKAQVNPNSIVILFDQGGYAAFLVLPSNVFL